MDENKGRKHKTKFNIISDISNMMKSKNVSRKLLIKISILLRHFVPSYKR